MELAIESLARMDLLPSQRKKIHDFLKKEQIKKLRELAAKITIVPKKIHIPTEYLIDA